MTTVGEEGRFFEYTHLSQAAHAANKQAILSGLNLGLCGSQDPTS